VSVDELLNIGSEILIKRRHRTFWQARHDIRQLAPAWLSRPQDRHRPVIPLDDDFGAGLHAIQHERQIPG
jgi:hypothetical protein